MTKKNSADVKSDISDHPPPVGTFARYATAPMEFGVDSLSAFSQRSDFCQPICNVYCERIRLGASDGEDENWTSVYAESKKIQLLTTHRCLSDLCSFSR